MLQIIQTRILSVVTWYHLAFFAISMAMFGLTAGAVWVYLHGDRYTEKTLSYDLAYFSMAFAVATAVCLAVQMTLVPMGVMSLTAVWTWIVLAVCMAIPFYFSGIAISLALTRSPFPIGRVYGVDMAGAGAGCLGVLLLLNWVDAPSAVLWSGAMAAAGALLFYISGIGEMPQRKQILDSLLRRRKTLFLILLLCALFNSMTDYGLQPLAVKGWFEGGNSHIFREWNSFSRIAVYQEQNGRPQMWGPSPKFWSDDVTIDARNMNIDGTAGTTSYRFSGDLKDAEFLKYDVTNLAYFLPERNSAAIIGVGGGRDILSAAVFGNKDITGVEINPIFVKLLTAEPGFAEFTNLTNLEGTKFVVEEGRSWFAQTDKSFDTIQMSLIDTWAATGAGAFTLSENGLYTVEAWKIFLNRLSPNGVFTISRWYDTANVEETGRMLSLAVATLLEMGVAEPQKHIFLASQGKIATLVLSRTPLSEEYLEALKKATDEYEHEILISPTVKPSSETLSKIIMTSGREELDRFTAGLKFDLTPPTDDRPFFFNILPLNKPIQALKMASGMFGGEGVAQGNLLATSTLIMLFIISLGLVLATIIIPLRPAIKDVGRGAVFGGTFYFLLIGVGFMMVEIGLLQRMSVFLGHPIYSLSVLLFTLILATGGGSLLSDRLELGSRTKFLIWAILTGVYLVSLPFWLSSVFHSFDGASLFIRAALCIVTIAPAGVLMGFGFPTGMRLISAIDRKPTPWFWGINGAAGVLASIVAVACSIALGISVTMILGAICYFLLIPVTFIFLQPQN